MRIPTLLILLNLLLLPGFALGQENRTVDLYIFYGQGCPHCSMELDFLDGIEGKYPGLEIHEHEIYFDRESRELFEELAGSFGVSIEGVPTVFIDAKVIVGFSNAIGEMIEQEIQKCSAEGCEDPLSKLRTEEPPDKIEIEESKTVKIVGDSSPPEDPEKTRVIKTLTLPAVISAAAVDAINPCAFAVLIILLTTILASSERKRALFAGLAFSLSIYISYFLMGLGLYSALQTTGLTHTFFWVVALLAIAIGLFNLKDYLWYGKWFIMEVPLSWRPKLKSMINGVTSVPGAFLIGFAVSLFLLPCTSGPYIVILGLLAKAASKNYAILLLLLYNFIFILPMLLITLAIYLGITTTEKLEEWRTEKLRVLHLITGIIILCLGIGMLIAMRLGMI